MRVLALAGGTGSAKLLRGLQHEIGDFTVVSNVGDNFWHRGLYVCPDIDIALYTLAGMTDDVRGWAIKDDTHEVLSQLGRMGEDPWFTIGDKDIATHIFRMERLRRGERLGEITAEMARRFGVGQSVIPCTEDALETYIGTEKGVMHLQEFWVKNHGELEITGVEYRGAENAKPFPRVLRELESADRIVFCPANPVTSVLPILAVPGIRHAIAGSRARKVAVSPFIGDSPISGPAGKMMKAMGSRPNCEGVAGLYSGLIDAMLIDPSDESRAKGIEALGVEAVPASILMKGPEDERQLARSLLEA